MDEEWLLHYEPEQFYPVHIRDVPGFGPDYAEVKAG